MLKFCADTSLFDIPCSIFNIRLPHPGLGRVIHCYILDLVKRIVRVSIATMKIVNALPALNEKTGT